MLPASGVLLSVLSEEGLWAELAAELPHMGCESRGLTLYARWWIIWACGYDSRKTEFMSIESLCG